MEKREIRHFHVFCGGGGGALGFNRGTARVGSLQAESRCLGGIDVVPDAIADFEGIAGVPGTVLDLFDRQQYIDWHGKEPPAGWKEVGPADIQKAAGGERPHIVFTSPPCKGFSGLLSQRKSETAKYQALNRLTVRGIHLTLEAWKDDPPEFFLLENVPRIATRGTELLEQIEILLQAYGYATARTTHDCGEIAGLAQSRKRFLLVARHIEKVPPFLYEPATRPLRSVGEVLGDFPLPGDPAAGAMHGSPRLQWKTWVRLAFVEAGKDWRSLQGLRVADGRLQDYLIMPESRRGYLGVNHWGEAAGTVTGDARPGKGKFAVADPRYQGQAYSQYGVIPWGGKAATVTSQRSPGQGPFSVADPRVGWRSCRDHCYGVVPWSRNAGAVTGNAEMTRGRFSVADPRPAPGRWGGGKYRITRFDQPANAVIAASTTGEGAFAVADPRPGLSRDRGDSYLTAGHYGVVDWADNCGAVTAAGRHDNGYGSIADPRDADGDVVGLPAERDSLVAVIRALDGTWHRPFTTLELAALQGLVQPGEFLELHGNSHSNWRERIGNMVPPPAAEAIFNVIAETLLLAWTGETFVLGSTPIWVQPIAVAASVDVGRQEVLQ